MGQAPGYRRWTPSRVHTVASSYLLDINQVTKFESLTSGYVCEMAKTRLHAAHNSSTLSTEKAVSKTKITTMYVASYC